MNKNETQLGQAIAVPVVIGGVTVHLQVSDREFAKPQKSLGGAKDELRGAFSDQARGVDLMDFGDVAKGIEALCRALESVLAKVAPTNASVEFSVGVTAKTGKLTALLLEGGVDGSIKVKLEWSCDQRNSLATGIDTATTSVGAESASVHK
jgi:hypothetical protein